MGVAGLKAVKFILVSLLAIILLSGAAAAAPGGPVYVVPIAGTIDPGLATFVERVYAEAEGEAAAAVILEIDTPGGLIASAQQMRNTIRRSPLTTIAYVREQALSAGVLISLAADVLVMAPGTTIGAAEPRVGTAPADEKTVSAWAGELAAAATEHGRDPEIARAMADADVAIPGVVEKGKLLTLTDQEALELNWIDAVIPTRSALFEAYDLQSRPLVEARLTGAENLARWITNPYFSSLLLLVGLAGIIIELFTVGFGIPGTIGLVALILYFGGSYLAGFAGWLAIFLVILGFILMLLEVLVIPGFGIAGIGGLVSLVAGILLSAPSWEQGVIYLLVALAGTAALSWLSLRLLPTRRVWDRLILRSREETAHGYTAAPTEKTVLVGREARAITPLRPAGVAELADGEKLDVVTEGEYVPPGSHVRIIKVEGGRIVVRVQRDE